MMGQCSFSQIQQRWVHQQDQVIEAMQNKMSHAAPKGAPKGFKDLVNGTYSVLRTELETCSQVDRFPVDPLGEMWTWLISW